jgi:hypothetical protein
MAYIFNVANQYLSTALAPVTAAPLTIALWNNNISVGSTLISLCTINGTHRFQITNPSGGLVNAITSDGTTTATASAGGRVNSVFNHIGAVFSANNNRIAYVNGTAGAANTTSVNPTTINTLLICAVYNTTLQNYHAGLIAEVGIWNAALTAAEFASLAKGMTCDKIRPQSLVFYAPLVRNLIDQKGGLTITNNNNATVANHPRVYA